MKIDGTIKVQIQPYTNATLGDLRTVLRKNTVGEWCHDLVGTVLEGTETSRLFHAKTSKDITGETLTVWGVKAWEIRRREVLRIPV